MEVKARCLTYPQPLGAASHSLGRPPMSWREWCLWFKKNEGVRAGMKRRKWTPFSEGEEEAGNSAEWETKSSRGLLEGWQMRGETMGWRGGDWEDLGGWDSTGQRLSRGTRKLAKGAGLGGWGAGVNQVLLCAPRSQQAGGKRNLLPSSYLLLVSTWRCLHTLHREREIT